MQLRLSSAKGDVAGKTVPFFFFSAYFCFEFLPILLLSPLESRERLCRVSCLWFYWKTVGPFLPNRDLSQHWRPYSGKALWSRTTKNPDVCSGPLACTAHSFTCTMLLAPLAQSTTLTHWLPRLMESKWYDAWTSGCFEPERKEGNSAIVKTRLTGSPTFNS